jgi:hypothetical protein
MESQVTADMTLVVLIATFVAAFFFTIAALKYLTLRYKIPPQVMQAFLSQFSYLSRVTFQSVLEPQVPVNKVTVIYYVVFAALVFFTPLMLWISMLIRQQFMLLALATIAILAPMWWSYSIIYRFRLISKQYKVDQTTH